MGEECTVSLSLFADPEQILRRFYIFAEEPRKSIITAIEPCSPVFKEAQPRPSNQSEQGNRAIHSVKFKSLIVVPPKVSRHFPHTHTHINIRELHEPSAYLLYSSGYTPSTYIYVSLRLRMQNAVPAQPCVGKLGISLVLLNFLHCNFRLWFKTP